MSGKILSWMGMVSFLFLSTRREITPAPVFSTDPVVAHSAIGTEEDPLARINYEMRILADPKTGKVPEGIRKRELLFSRKIPDRHTYYAARGREVAVRNYDPGGPFNVGGRTRAAALDVRDENTIIAGGVSGSIWKTTNGGVSWTRTSDISLRNSVTCLTQDTRTGEEDTWYFGTGELVGNSAGTNGSAYRGAGIFKSTDNGDSWFQLSSTDDATHDEFSSQFQYSWNILSNHARTDVDEVLVACFGGILKSQDGGSTWEVELGEKLFDLPDTNLNLAPVPFYTNIIQTSEGHFYATLSSATGTPQLQLYPDAGIFFSADGETWIEITPSGFPELHRRTVMGFSRGDERKVYFLTQWNQIDCSGGSNCPDFMALYAFDLTTVISGMPAGSWTNLSQNVPSNFDSQSSYNMMIAAHPTNPDVVYLGGTILYRSLNGFASSVTTEVIGGYINSSGAVYPNHHPDQHLILFYPSNPNKMITANDGGLRLTLNNLADSVMWTSLNNGMITSQFYTITQERTNPTDLVLGGMQDNGSYLRAVPVINPSWNRILGGDGGYCAITPNDFYYVSFQNSQIYRLTLNDNFNMTSFARIDPSGGGSGEQGYLFVNPYILDPANPNRMYLLGGDVIWLNYNLAQIAPGSQGKTTTNWKRLFRTRLTSGVYSTLEKPETGDRLYAGWSHGENRPGIVRLDEVTVEEDDERVILNTNLFPPGGYLICIASDPEDEEHIIAVVSNYNTPSIFESFDGGLTFTDIGGNLEGSMDGTGDGPSIRWAEIIPIQSGTLYMVGTSTGLYSTELTDGANTVWVKEAPETIGSAVVTMMNYRHTDGRLVVATHGNGTFLTYVTDFRNITEPTNKSSIQLSQSFPNPFPGSTNASVMQINFRLPQDGEVRIDIYNDKGQLIRNLLWGPQYAGLNTVTWDGTTNTGIPVNNGIYFYQLVFREKVLGKKLLINR